MLDIIFNASYGTFTRRDLLALSVLNALRELGVVSRSLDAGARQPYHRFRCNFDHITVPHSSRNIITYGTLLAFVAELPELRRLELIVPLGHIIHRCGDDETSRCGGSGCSAGGDRRSSSVDGPFLALLAERCQRLEVVRLAGLYALEALEHAPVEPAFPYLRRLHVYSLDQFYRQAKPRCVFFFSPISPF